MNYRFKFFTVFFCLMFSFCLLQAQKHFIYIQSENQQPFAVVMNGKVFSSSDYGYVILSKLADGKYDFTISFPLNKFPDQSFSITVNKKDEGYALNNGVNGWALQNLYSDKTLSNTTAETEKKNAFGNMLSDVVDDSTLTRKVLPTADTIAKNNTVVVVDSFYQPQKISLATLDTGTNMLFVDKTTNGSDTVNLFIPLEASTSTANQAMPQANTATQAIDTVAQQTTSSSNTVVENNTPDTTAHQSSNPFYNSAENRAVINTVDTNSVKENSNQTSTTNNTVAMRQDCVKMVSDDDLNKMKRKMFSHSDDKSMIDYAVKFLSNKCISTEQVKSLGRLFSSDDGRYNLFDALYTLTYDYGNYSSLSSQIIDPYYKKRFEAMIR